MSLFLINAGMTCSILLFYSGYWFRFRNNRLHRILNGFGILFNLVTAVYLLGLKYMGGGMEQAGLVATVPREYVDIHRAIAALTLLMMLLMGWSGWTGKKEFHRKLHFIFLPLYTLVYLSGLFLFRSGH
ncbi:hypothetical protein EHQ27_17055 [Leptospira wolffii]|uniref:DUF420 domain-containing protein n=1 Tax=Leptospira wolffii TaxID=409998 RepID=A0A2M9Z795_9LEPT|nr:hypothetical protein [Leptospira wolffii]PJZ64303.1 hypothetical protein CH371_17920 [Leptospira wolffii]TGK58263.1 hypothetical protein EHQ32_13330 [Leptospira wolffii]TGK66360.1 hypothetical protein EHQ27_17055 [Leptospira wolffii]TGK68941.1 hypothetical protein EHQ35_19200 [Leptospira wolffii]TGL27293.1 hypothetical protein EHQ57_17180 [Leptospira wolffii]